MGQGSENSLGRCAGSNQRLDGTIQQRKHNLFAISKEAFKRAIAINGQVLGLGPRDRLLLGAITKAKVLLVPSRILLTVSSFSS